MGNLLMLLACSVDNPIHNHLSHCLRLAFCKVLCILCERGLGVVILHLLFFHFLFDCDKTFVTSG